MNGLTDRTLAPKLFSTVGSKKKKKNNKQSIISLCPSFFEKKKHARNTRTQPTTSLSAYTTGTVRLSKRITVLTSVYTSA